MSAVACPWHLSAEEEEELVSGQEAIFKIVLLEFCLHVHNITWVLQFLLHKLFLLHAAAVIKSRRLGGEELGMLSCLINNNNIALRSCNSY